MITTFIIISVFNEIVPFLGPFCLIFLCLSQNCSCWTKFLTNCEKRAQSLLEAGDDWYWILPGFWGKEPRIQFLSTLWTFVTRTFYFTLDRCFLHSLGLRQICKNMCIVDDSLTLLALAHNRTSGIHLFFKRNISLLV